ncbi:MAG: cellulase family glycosylhydrolase [Alphaproteobacteria bacterium]|nr:cellulase family glycosylhydrolase [Alphaproteobacteria bacterium]
MKILVLCILLLLSEASARAAQPALPVPPIPQSFGVNIHFLDKDLDANMAYLKKAGFGWVRQDMFWETVERIQGDYDFSAYDRLAAAAQAANIRVLFILDYSNPLYDHDQSPASPEARAAFADFAAAAADHFAGQNVAWEIYNEPNWGFWRPEANVDQYIALANAATFAIRKADPAALVMGPALAGPTRDAKLVPAALDFLDKVLHSRAAHQWNAITIHPYRGNDAPESIEPQLATIRRMMQSDGIDPARIPLIAGEWGYSTWLRGVDEETQAAYVVRALLEGTAARMPFTIWYDWQDDGPNIFDREFKFGLLRQGSLADAEAEDIEKPAFLAIQELAGLLRGYRFDSVIARDDHHVFLAFKGKADRAYVLWTAEGEHTLDITLPPGKWTATRLLGGTEQVQSAKGRATSILADIMPTIVKPAAQGNARP